MLQSSEVTALFVMSQRAPSHSQNQNLRRLLIISRVEFTASPLRDFWTTELIFQKDSTHLQPICFSSSQSGLIRPVNLNIPTFKPAWKWMCCRGDIMAPPSCLCMGMFCAFGLARTHRKHTHGQFALRGNSIFHSFASVTGSVARAWPVCACERGF